MQNLFLFGIIVMHKGTCAFFENCLVKLPKTAAFREADEKNFEGDDFCEENSLRAVGALPVCGNVLGTFRQRRNSDQSAVHDEVDIVEQLESIAHQFY